MTQIVDGAQFFAGERLRWSEREFQAAVVKLAEERGWLAYHTHDSRRSNAGFPYLTIVIGKRLIFAELKREKGSKATMMQLGWLVDLSGVPMVETYLWRPSNWNAGEIEGVLR